MKKSAFTMIELVFVIVILGILAAVAIPRMSATRTDAQISKAKSDIASIRSSIITERQGRLLQGDSSYIAALDDAAIATEDETIFDGNSTSALLMYGVNTKDSDGHWMKTSATAYTLKIGGEDNNFTYTPSSGKFECTGGSYCNTLTQ